MMEVVSEIEPSALMLSLFVLLACALVWLILPAKTQASESSSPQAGVSFKSEDSGFRSTGPRLTGTFTPSTGIIEANAPAVFPFENENCYGEFLPLHRPTHDASLENSGNYPYASHFKGRKRLWEMRWTFRFKHEVDGLMFGVELDEYVPVNAATKRVMGLIVSMLRQTVGSELYHSPGDDPKIVSGDTEKPVFTMPLFAFDQFILTPQGEDPPDLTDPGFADLGVHRVKDRAAFIRQISDLKLKPGPSYTFAFWGISQFLDNVQWKVQKVIPFKTIDFNQLCGAPPVAMVLYTLRKDGNVEDKRHLQRRKDYFFHMAFWSTLKPPRAERLQQLVPSLGKFSEAEVSGKGAKKGWSQMLEDMELLTCCATHRR